MDDRVGPVEVLTKSVKRPCPPPMASDPEMPEMDGVIEQRISKRVASSTGPEFLRVVITLLNRRGKRKEKRNGRQLSVGGCH